VIVTSKYWTSILATGSLAAVLLIGCTAQPPSAAVPMPDPSATIEFAATRAPAPSPSATLAATATLSVLPTATDPTATAVPPIPTPTRLPTPDGVTREAHVPILMYHHIAPPSPSDDAIRKDLTVSPSDLDDQLRYLKGHGYEPILMDTLMRNLTLGEALPAKPVVLTFDDGYDDNYAYALPLLSKYGFRGTFFVMTDPVDARRSEYMSWDQVREMSVLGMEMEPHSRSHPDLRNRTNESLVWEILGSKEAVEAHTGVPCRYFAYPSGKYDGAVIAMLKSAFFWGAVTTEPGDLQSSSAPFELKRIRVHGAGTIEQFAAILGAQW
jgi:peptidoglycan/xylan/chitin deacetylase (PgdA/CDA1 family)